jgi:DNA helicase-2/ATP-dependent DNA helicase PcrA
MALPEKAQELLKSLDSEQAKAATSPIGPVRIVAGAGTGKTRTLIHRIAYWHYMGVAPANKVLAVTFTRKSAKELRYRLSNMGITGVSALTFHSAALSQLKEYWVVGGQKTEFPEVLTGRDQYLAIRNAITRSLKPSEDPKVPKRKVDSVLQRFVTEELTMMRSRMVELERYALDDSFKGPKGGITKEEFISAIQKYEDFKKARNLIDYADALFRCVRMIENVPHVAEKIRQRYEHFLVDEYQDNDPVQERLLRAWLGNRKSICVVGDPRQTIFSFKGADPKIMRDFPSSYEGAITVELTQNYRSTKSIVEWANRLMRNTSASGGAKAELNPNGNKGWLPQIRSYYTEKVEMEQTGIRIRQLAEKAQLEYRDIAVLLRFRDDVAKVRRSLTLAGVPSVSPNDEFWRDVDPVLRAMGKMAKSGTSSSGKQCLENCLENLGWIRAEEVEAEEQDEYAEIAQILLDITNSIEGVESLGVVELLDSYKRLESEGGDEGDGNAVSVMTLHQSKGLEWEAVFIPRFVEGALPTSHAKTTEQIDEERRLAYVGITRARRYLEISWGETYKYLDKTRSQSVSSFEQFLRTPEVQNPKIVDKKTEEWNKRFQPPPKKKLTTKSLVSYEVISGSKEQVGSIVRHPELGEGKVVAVNQKYVIIDFGKEGKFQLELPPY